VSRTFRILIVAVVAIVAVGGYWKLVLSPKREQVTTLDGKIAAQQAALSQTQATLANYTNAKQAYKTDYATLVRLGKAVPGDDDVRSLVVQVDAAAKRSGVGFDNIDVTSGGASPTTNVGTTAPTTGTVPPGAVAAGAFSAMPFSLSFSGTFGTLSRFFARLDRFVTVDQHRIAVDGRLLRVESIDLEPGEGGWPSIKALIGASSYIVPAAPALGAAAPAATGAGTATTTAAPGTTPATAAAPTASTGTGINGAPSTSTTASAPPTSTSSGDLR
jgi:Tfp pilus assembly protein PilO